MRVLVSGAAGFIGFHVAAALLRRGDTVVNFDNINDYYDVDLKRARLQQLTHLAASYGSSYNFIHADLSDKTAVNECFETYTFDRVINLAAQAGVRHSFHDPHSYASSNVIGFLNLIECCRHHKVTHLTYASTSSVYGANRNLPFSEHNGADHPLQFYAATKRMNELTAHAYSHLFRLPTTGLRFFTVYGPWGRPDMALAIFTRSVILGEPVQLYNNGRHSRDFTYIDDIVEGVVRASDDIAASNSDWDPSTPDPQSSLAPWRIMNIGGGRPVPLREYLREIEEAVGRNAIVELAPMQPGDVEDSTADFSELERTVGFRPQISTRDGVREYVKWFRSYYGI